MKSSPRHKQKEAQKADEISTEQKLDQAKRMMTLAAGLVILATILLLLAYRVEHRSFQQLSAIPETPVQFNQPISIGRAEMRVESVLFVEGQGPFKAPSGKGYAVAKFVVKNKSDKPIQVLPANDIYVKNTVGEVEYVTPFSISQPFRAGELLPGEQIKGELSFLIKTGMAYNLYVDAIWSGGVVTFDFVH